MMSLVCKSLVILIILIIVEVKVMPKYRIYVPMTFDDVYLVEAASIEEAKAM